ncbi:DUF4401 domain-containing protein [Glaciimonas sp. PCH181]|uniref:DUF4401 domain-containing protein n=1 Tax=Glaciimonas sp. PCH181 TaxID=2133943 RepID=UPI001375298E|nr:DUF4401 domain-containing protein [Glaciimonas sp. PCH181]
MKNEATLQKGPISAVAREGPSLLWQQLHADGYVDAEHAPPSVIEAAASPWYVRVMLGICGGVGALFLLAFFSIFLVDHLMREDATLITAGLILVGCAALIYRLSTKGAAQDLRQQFALALSLAGQGMAGFWLFATYGGNVAWPFFGIALCQLLLIVLVPNFLHRVLSTVFSLLALHIGCLMLLGPSPALPICAGLAALFWLDESNLQRRLPQAFLPIAVGLTLALLSLALTSVWFPYSLLVEVGADHRSDGLGDSLYRWLYLLDPVVVGLIFLSLVLQLTSSLTFGRRCAALVVALILAVLGGWVIGLVLGAMLMLLGFARGRHMLTSLGIVASLGYLSWFYYALEWTLLIKSIGLMLLGAALLSGYFILGRLSTEIKHA